MKIVEQNKWVPCDGIVLEESANFVARSQEDILVVAGPGAGKTELLAQKASYLFQTNTCNEPQKILAISFKKDAAENLKKRVAKRCGNEVESRFISMTFDAFSKSILDHFTFALPESLRPDQTYLVGDDEIINAAFQKAGFTNPYNLSSSKLKKYYDSILSAVQLPFSKDGLGEKVWKFLLKGFDGHNATLSFKMISILAEYIIRSNPKIKRSLQITYKYVFLDEFQDTTDLQYELVKQCFLGSNSIITAVGDNKQRIMVWAGARKTIFKDFEKDFKAKTKKLIMNHRSAPRLVDLQRKMYDSLNEKDNTIAVSEKWNPNDGDVSLLIAENEQQEATTISKHISARISEGIEPNKLCILCKQTPQKYTSKLIEELSKDNIYARIENDYQDVLKEAIVEMFISLIRLAINIRNPHDWEFIVSTTLELWSIDPSQPNDDYFKMQDSLSNEIKQISALMKNVYNKRDFHQLLQHALDFWGIANIKSSFPTYQQGNYLGQVLTKFQDFLWKELQTTKMDWTLALENFQGLHSVPIMTIHKSKGLEYDVVYFMGLEDSAFWNFRNQPEEDRCAFFVALSRAKKEMFFTFSKFRNSTTQSHYNINEFFELLKTPGIAKIIQ